MTKGSPRRFGKRADSGNTITSFFCGDCGSTLWRESDTYAGAKIVKFGAMDHPGKLEDARPAAELFAGNRPSWLQPVAGAQQNEAA